MLKMEKRKEIERKRRKRRSNETAMYRLWVPASEAI
jgi:hypothetical protein